MLQTARRREEARRHLQRQIEELYSPLLGLIQYGAAVNVIERQILPHGARDDVEGEVLRFIRERYYLPLNAQMIDLIRAKIYLLDTDAPPESFQRWKPLTPAKEHARRKARPTCPRVSFWPSPAVNRYSPAAPRHSPSSSARTSAPIRVCWYSACD